MILAARWGLLRSLLTYYAIPFRISSISHFYRQFIQPGDLCFDIGAHVGNRVRALLNAGAQVVAAEPQPDFFRLLTRIYGQNQRVTLLETAIGAAPGTADLLISQRTPTVTTLSQAWTAQVGQAASFAGVQWDTTHTVTVTTLDTLISEHGRPAYCKIDVEGFELEVLRGLSQPIKWISFEYIPTTRDQALACLERLAELGEYSFNWTVAERSRFESADWLSLSHMADVIHQLPEHARSGDIYARLV